MKYIDFYQILKNSYPILSRADINKLTDGGVLDVQLSDWVKKGFLIKPRRNIYILKDNQNISPFIIANRLFEPSYISLESALFYYGLIPDVIAAVTSVTSKKTRKFEFDSQTFNYQKIKNNLFFGYQAVKEDKWTFLIATPEKVILDYFYLNLSKLKNEDAWHDLRMDSKTYINKINKVKLFRLLNAFNMDKLSQVVKKFDKYIRT